MRRRSAGQHEVVDEYAPHRAALRLGQVNGQALAQEDLPQGPDPQQHQRVAVEPVAESVPGAELRPGFPWYALFLARINRVTLRDSLRCPGLALWDEERRRMIRFDELDRVGA